MSRRLSPRRNRRGDNRQFVARLNSCSSPRRSPVVCTRGDCRGDRRGDDCRDSRLVSGDRRCDDRSDSRENDHPVYTPYNNAHVSQLSRRSLPACIRMAKLNITQHYTTAHEVRTNCSQSRKPKAPLSLDADSQLSTHADLHRSNLLIFVQCIYAIAIRVSVMRQLKVRLTASSFKSSVGETSLVQYSLRLTEKKAQ